MCFQIELTTNVILTKKILDIKIKKAKKIKEKDNLVNQSQAIEQVTRRIYTDAPQYGEMLKTVLLILGYKFICYKFS